MVYNRNNANNFWVYTDLTYDEFVGTEISDITMLNGSEYPVFLNNVVLESGDRIIVPQYKFYGKGSDMGTVTTIAGPPTPFKVDKRVVITIEIGWTVNVGQGPFQIYPDFVITIPSLSDAQQLFENGPLP